MAKDIIFLNNYIRCAFIVLLIFAWSGVGAQDTLYVRGKIFDGANRPIPNVSIGVSGSQELPSLTNEAGEFKVVVSSPADWLNIEPGNLFKSKKVFLAGRNDLTIYLSPVELPGGDNKIEFQGQQILQKNIIAAYSALNMNQVKTGEYLTVDRYFQGRIPGMFVVNHSGNPWSGAYTLLRGVNSLNTTNQPLYVVDGIPVTSFGVFNSLLEGNIYNPLLGINPLDITRTTVLKDPAMTAIYGSQASNGVIMIETLDPSSTQTTIDLDFRYGFTQAPFKTIPQMNALQHRSLMSELLFSSGIPGESIRKEYPNLFLTQEDDNYIDYQHDTNWQDVIFSDAAFSNLNLTVKGGDETARYGISGGFINSEGVIKSTDYQGYNVRFVGNLSIFKWLKLNSSVSLNYNKSALKPSAESPETSPILTSLAKSPILQPFQYDEFGNQMNVLTQVDQLGVSNPEAVIQNYSAENQNFQSRLTLDLEASINANLSIHSNFSLSYDLLKERIFMPTNGMELYYDDEAYNVAKASNNSLKSFFNNTYLNYAKNLGKYHFLNVNSGINIENSKFEYDWAMGQNAMPNDQYRDIQDGSNPSLRQLGGRNRVWNWLSVYGQAFYSFKDKYLVNATLCLDGSSKIGREAENTINIGDTPFGLFYSGGLGWRISNETFLHNAAWLEELKLRVSYGVTGNDDIGEVNSRKFYQSVKFRETVGLIPAVIENEKLTYETVSQLNGGLDLGLWGSRLYTSVDVYMAKTDNMIIGKPMEAYYGFVSQAQNGGEMQNSGIDISLFLRAIDKENFKWDMQFSFATVKNEIMEIEGGSLISSVPGINGIEIANIPGEHVNSYYGYLFNGVYSTTDEAQSAGLVNDKYVPYKAGDAIYADISGPDGNPDGVINNYDKTTIGAPIPDYFGGLNTTFTYKRWSVNAFIQMADGLELFNYIRFLNERMTGLENQSKKVLDRWQYEGQKTSVPRALWNDPIGNSAFSTRWIEDGSYIQLKNVSLAYTIPTDFLVFRNAQFYFSVSNILSNSKYLGYDPDFGGSTLPTGQGIDRGLAPQSKQFIFGIKLGL
jgi:TonB-linked SusC/RagA family outer membrane protein